jgi:hypothetical protein
MLQNEVANRLYKFLTGNRTGTQVGTDQTATYANSALINTQVTIDIAAPTYAKQRYKIVVYNPSTVTDLTIKIMSTETSLGAGTRYAFLDSMTVPKSAAYTGTTINAYEKEVEGIFTGAALRLVVSNDTALGGSDGFSAYIRVRECF